MEKKKNHIIASEGKTLIRTKNGEVMGKELWLGTTYWVGGERVEPFVEVAENFSEISDEEVSVQRLVYKSESGLEAALSLYDGGLWLKSENEESEESEDKEYITLDELKAVIEKYGGIGELEYSSLVTRLVRLKYSSDDMEALVNNYMYDKGAYGTQWEQMQSWRVHCKAFAKELLSVLSNS